MIIKWTRTLLSGHITTLYDFVRSFSSSHFIPDDDMWFIYLFPCLQSKSTKWKYQLQWQIFYRRCVPLHCCIYKLTKDIKTPQPYSRKSYTPQDTHIFKETLFHWYQRQLLYDNECVANRPHSLYFFSVKYIDFYMMIWYMIYLGMGIFAMYGNITWLSARLQ